MRICVVGIGRMGLPVAVKFASAGNVVVGADHNVALVDAINAGRFSDPSEPGLDNALSTALASGALTCTTATKAAVASAEAVIVLVRLSVDAAGLPDYAAIDSATAAIGAGLQPGTLVCYETTLPAGDTRGRFLPALERASGLAGGVDFNLCFSPERVSSGSIFRDLGAYPKIVGGLTDRCADVAEELYSRHLGASVLRVSALETAELVKLAETTYRDVNIALANELAMYADELSIDIGEVIAGANSQPYSHIHQAGLGVGGHCIPIYPRFIIARAARSELMSAARRLNDDMPAYAVQRLGEILGDLAGAKILVLGLTFRGDIPETSNSMAVPLIAALVDAGAEVRAHDAVLGPEAASEFGVAWQEPGSPWAAGVVLQAAHSPYRSLGPADLPGITGLLDGRGILDARPWAEAGVRFAGIGR